MSGYQVVWSNGDASDRVFHLDDAIVVAERAADDTAIVYDDQGQPVWTYYGEIRTFGPSQGRPDAIHWDSQRERAREATE